MKKDKDVPKGGDLKIRKNFVKGPTDLKRDDVAGIHEIDVKGENLGTNDEIDGPRP